MTNYNERFDEILFSFADYIKHHQKTGLGGVGMTQYDTKQALTSLTKELVAEAKPKDMDSFYEKPIVDEFEQNLLKALEEV